MNLKNEIKNRKKSTKNIDKHIKNIIYYDSIGVLSNDVVKLTETLNWKLRKLV